MVYPVHDNIMFPRLTGHCRLAESTTIAFMEAEAIISPPDRPLTNDAAITHGNRSISEYLKAVNSIITVAMRGPEMVQEKLH